MPTSGADQSVRIKPGALDGAALPANGVLLPEGLLEVHSDGAGQLLRGGLVTASKVTASKVTASKVTASKVTASEVPASEVGLVDVVASGAARRIGPFELAQDLELSAGHLRLAAARVYVEVGDGDVRLLVEGPAARLDLALLVVPRADLGTEVVVPVHAAPGAVAGVRLGLATSQPEALFDVREGRLQLRADVQLGSCSVGGALSLLTGDFLAATAASGKLGFGPITLGGSATATAGAHGLSVSGVTLAMPVGTARSAPSARVSVGFAATLDFGPDLVLRSPVLSMTSVGEAWLLADPAQPFTLVLGEGVSWRLALDPADPKLWALPGEKPAARLFFPGVAKTATAARAARFELHAAGHAPAAAGSADPGTRLLVTPGGLELSAEAVLRDVLFGRGHAPSTRPNAVLSVKTMEGRAAIAGGAYALHVRGVGDLPYFDNAGGTLDGLASSGGRLPVGPGAGLEPGVTHFRFTPDLAEPWLDPSHLMALDAPEAEVRVHWRKEGGTWDWDVRGTLSGTLQTRMPETIEDAAEAWLGRFFEQTAMVFRDTAMSELRLAHGEPQEVVTLELVPVEPIEIDFFGVLVLEIQTIGLRWLAVELGGKVTLKRPGREAGGGKKAKSEVSLEATLPKVVLGLAGGRPYMGFAELDSGNFELEGTLKVGEGLTIELLAGRQTSEAREAIYGSGSLALEGLPTVGMTFLLGRNRPHRDAPWQPMIAMFGTVDQPVQLYKGIVLREYGAGFGYGLALSGLERGGALDTLGVPGFVKSDLAFPEPKSPDSWVDDPGRFTLAARTFVAPTKLDRSEPQPYLLDAILTVDDRFNVVFLASAWLFTSITDASTPAFRTNPVARGAVVLYPRHLTIEGYAETRPDPVMSLDIGGVLLAMAGVRGSFSFFASPERLAVAIGPFTRYTRMGPFSVERTMLVAVEWVGDNIAAVVQASLHARMHLAEAIKLDIGIIALSAGIEVTAHFGFEAMFAGGRLPVDGRDAIVLYSRLSVTMSGSVKLWIAIEFELDFGFFSVSFSFSWTFQLSVSFDASLQGALVDDEVGLTGGGTVRISVMDWTLSFRMDIAVGAHRQVGKAEQAFGTVLDRLLQG